MPTTVTRTFGSDCDDLQSITLEHLGSRTKTCYYKSVEFSEPELVAAAAKDDSRSDCGVQLASKGAPSACGPSIQSPLCDRTSHRVPEPAKGCFDLFGGECGVCCPSKPPDCRVEPDGYPGYTAPPSPLPARPCVSLENPFCSCSCQQGAWSCAC